MALLPRFNALLREGRLLPEDVLLVRHSESRKGRVAHARLRDWALARRGSAAFARFESYQAHQSKPRFTRPHVAGFVSGMDGETIFLGVWHVQAATVVDVADPLAMLPGLLHFWRYDLAVVDEFVHLHGRLAVEWGASERAWVQYADRQDKRILRLSPASVKPFPGWPEFRVPLSSVPDLPPEWRAVLDASRGVYLLVHRPTGQQYVGAAPVSFLKRWLGYDDGHGGNTRLEEIAEKADAYDVSVLEVASSLQSADDVLAREAWWKVTLGSRAFGLNAN
jgi:hypothetical protein